MVNNEQHHEVDLQAEEQVRLEKLEKIQEAGINPYPEKFDKKQSLSECFDLPEGTEVQTAGRLMLMRDMGKLCFAHLQDFDKRMQIALHVGDDENSIAKDAYKFFVKHFDLGDFVGVKGNIGVTKKGEKTIFVTEYVFLGKALKPMPGKWHGLADQEVKYRQRYLDLIADEQTRKRFKFRSDFIKALREFYWDRGFDEVETPILTNAASGALAKPFVTHHNALDTDVFLRIAPETYLKECVVGGYEKVFEVGRLFRNEGIDPSHLQDYTSVEHYCAYWNYEDNMQFTEEMFSEILPKTLGSMTVEIPGRDGEMQTVDFSGPWKRISFRDLLIQDCGIDIDQFPTADELRAEIHAKGIEFEKDVDISSLGRGNLIDTLYKKVSRPKIVNPTFVIQHPIDVSPLARQNDDNPKIVDRFQLVVNTWEVINAYSELVDPVEQEKRFESQAEHKEAGDDEAHDKDDEYVESMRYGMPPISGFGMGIDRIVSLLTAQTNLRDVVLFPLMRPKNDNSEQEDLK